MDCGLLLDDTALRLLGIGLRVLAHEVDALDNHTVLLGENGKNLAGLAFIVTGIYIHGVTFLDLELFHTSD